MADVAKALLNNQLSRRYDAPSNSPRMALKFIYSLPNIKYVSVKYEASNHSNGVAIKVATTALRCAFRLVGCLSIFLNLTVSIRTPSGPYS